MSNCIAGGDTFWRYPSAQGDVLYFALEGTNKRLQERLNKVSPVCNIDAPTDIHFVTNAQKLGDGLADQIGEFLDTHPNTKLIVIDTLQYIRNNGKFTGTYSGDYQDMNGVKVLSARENIAEDASGVLLESVLDRRFSGK